MPKYELGSVTVTFRLAEDQIDRLISVVKDMLDSPAVIDAVEKISQKQ